MDMQEAGEPLRWGARLPDPVGQPAIVRQLLEQGLAANPRNATLHAKLGYLHLDRFDFAAAAASLEQAIRLGSGVAKDRILLARCYNHLGRHDAAIEILADEAAPVYERGLALMESGRLAEAEREFRLLLAEHPNDMYASRKLCRLLRKSERGAELLAVCEDLAARGGGNAQLFYNWGWALALAGEADRARRLMFEPEHIAQIELPVPDGFGDIAELNQALAEELLANPNMLSDFPIENEANRGSQRIDNLSTCRRQKPIDALLTAIEGAAAAYHPPLRDGFDPWPRVRPATARLRPWGLLQRGGAYEAGHIHPSGWLSGVYYVRIPRSVSLADGARGCIEFGPPGSLAQAMPGIAPTQAYQPREGLLLLAPSHYEHRTIPSDLDEDRISISFDVVPQRTPAG